MATQLAVKISPQDDFFVQYLARKYTREEAARLAYGLKGDDEQIARFAKAKLYCPDVREALELARMGLKEIGCVTRAEKRWAISQFIRDSADPDTVLKAIAIDNRMQGEEVGALNVDTMNVYVARAGDVIELDEDDCV